ncbi:hypothetical protein [Kitasatospora sp. NPDC094015]|uniref:hypothetical protein n=1 Tax=Kitasatospora sp. NPDC094015 TaxID=3155205 RepID=UPI00331E9DDB
MSNSVRTFRLPALALAVLLGAAACAGPAAPPSADAAAAATPAAPARGGATPQGTGEALVVAAARPGPQQTAVVTPSPGGPAVAPAARSVRLAAYDPATGTAVLAAAPGPAATGAAASPSATASATKGSPGPSRTPSTTPSTARSASPSPDGTPPAAEPVQAGQLIASPPTPAAPQGALLAVTKVQPGADGTVRADTRPATLPELLGGAEADGRVPVDPHALSVKPLVEDVKLSFGADAGGATAEASGTLQLDVRAPIPLPGGAAAQASGSLRLHPAVHFAYHGAQVGAPRTASVGFDLDAHAQWRVEGELAKGTGTPVRVPLAELHANPVITVGGLPVVVNLGLTAYLEVSADGKVSASVEQEFDGSWHVDADYSGGRGWSPVTAADDTKVSPVRARLGGKAEVRAGLGAQVSVGLYGAVGVEAVVQPYLRATAEGAVAFDTAHGLTQAQGTLSLYGGVDLTGALLAHLTVFGTPVVEGRIPLPAFHREWPLRTVTASAAPTAR